MISSFTKAIVCMAVLAAIGGFAQAETIGFWQFNEGQPGDQTTGVAGEILDSSANGHHGTAVGTTTLPSYAAGHYDPTSAIALTRTGSGSDPDPNADRIEVPHDAAFNFDLGVGDDFTLEAFIKTTDSTNPMGIVAKRESGSGYSMALEGGKLSVYLQEGAGATHPAGTWNFTNPRPTGLTNVADGEWHHVAVVVDADAANSDNSVIKFYVDWLLDDTVLLKDAVWFDPPSPVNMDLSNDHDVWIGDFCGRAKDQFVGDIDAVRISSGALTPSEFLPVPEPSTVVLLAGLCGVGLVLLRRRQR